MPVRECEHCSKVYVSTYSGIPAVLCKVCHKACEEAYPVIHDFLLENQKQFRVTDKELISEITGIPGLFVWILAREGRLNNMITPDASMDKSCKRCGEQILSLASGGEKDLCASCIRVLKHQLQTTTFNHAAHLSSGDRVGRGVVRERRYGLGR